MLHLGRCPLILVSVLYPDHAVIVCDHSWPIILCDLWRFGSMFVFSFSLPPAKFINLQPFQGNIELVPSSHKRLTVSTVGQWGSHCQARYSTHEYLYTSIPVHMYTYTPVYLYIYIPAHLYTCIPAHMYTCIPIHLYTCIPVHLYTYTSVYLYTIMYLSQFL